jgi:hypothetical protein
VLSTPPRQTRDDIGGADGGRSGVADSGMVSGSPVGGGDIPALVQPRDTESSGQPADEADQDQPPVPFTVLAPWKAAVSAGERPVREEPEDRPFTTPAPKAPEGRNPKPPETVPWYAAPSVVADPASEAASEAGLAPRASFAPYGVAPSSSSVVPSGFAPGSDVSATPRSTSNAPTSSPGSTTDSTPTSKEAQA